MVRPNEKNIKTFFFQSIMIFIYKVGQNYNNVITIILTLMNYFFSAAPCLLAAV